jgi:hypothetical protein
VQDRVPEGDTDGVPASDPLSVPLGEVDTVLLPLGVAKGV